MVIRVAKGSGVTHEYFGDPIRKRKVTSVSIINEAIQHRQSCLDI